MGHDPLIYWKNVQALVTRAHEQSDVMRNSLRPDDRNEAARSYATAVDQLVAQLGILGNRGVLDAVAEFLERSYPRVAETPPEAVHNGYRISRLPLGYVVRNANNQAVSPVFRSADAALRHADALLARNGAGQRICRSCGKTFQSVAPDATACQPCSSADYVASRIGKRLGSHDRQLTA